MAPTGIHVIKLGGSLLGLPDLVDRFNRWRAADAESRPLLVVGGGVSADVVRHFDRHAKLDEHAGHWFAVRAMQLNAHVIAAVIGDCGLASDLAGCEALWHEGKLAVMDPLVWLEQSEARGETAVPHRWTFTSDSIAAHVATQLDADRLTLLKSRLPEEGDGLAEAAASGLVDADFPGAARRVRSVVVVNLRASNEQGLQQAALRAAAR